MKGTIDLQKKEAGATSTVIIATLVHFTYCEKICSDFLLADPQGAPAFVPGSKYKTKFYSVEDISDQDTSHGRGIKSFFTGDMGRKDTIEEMLRRHGQQSMFGGDDKGKFRYHESSFSVNEQVAILGTAQPYNHQGVSITILNPPDTSILTEDYFAANEWTDNEKKSWEALTAQPSVIGSDDPKYFKGITVEDIPYSYSPFSFCAPVYYGQHQPPQMMMQQQGQPMMMQQQGQPMMMQQQGQPMMMQQQGQPMMMQQQGQPMMMQQQGQPMMMQQQGQPMIMQQAQPMMMQQGQGQNYGPSTVVPMQQQNPSVQVIPTVAPGAVVPTNNQ